MRAPFTPVHENAPVAATPRYTSTRDVRKPHRNPVKIGTKPDGSSRWGHLCSPEEEEAVVASPEDHADDVDDAGPLTMADRIARYMGNVRGLAP